MVSLDKLRLSNVEQVRMAYELLRLQEPVIEFFLLRLFPQYMRHQQVKLHPQLSSEGLRLEHIKEILRSLKANITREIGPPETRPSAVMFASWISQAGGVVVICLTLSKPDSTE